MKKVTATPEEKFHADKHHRLLILSTYSKEVFLYVKDVERLVPTPCSPKFVNDGALVQKDFHKQLASIEDCGYTAYYITKPEFERIAGLIITCTSRNEFYQAALALMDRISQYTLST